MGTKLYIKKGDMVKVLTGNSKGKDGKVLKIMKDEYRAIVEGINMVSRHTKPKAKNTKGTIIKKEAPIHISNLMVLDNLKQPTRVGRKIDNKGKLVRYSKKTGEVIK